MENKKQATEIGIYPGTFDPVTYGHIDIIKRALKIFSKVIIAISDNPEKKPLFSMEERIEMLKESFKGLDVEVEYFTGLLVDYAKKNNCKCIIRSMRAVSDFDYEFQMASVNRDLDGDIETVFLMTDTKYLYLHSGLVKEIAQRGGKLDSMVSENVSKKLREKYKL